MNNSKRKTIRNLRGGKKSTNKKTPSKKVSKTRSRVRKIRGGTTQNDIDFFLNRIKPIVGPNDSVYGYNIPYDRIIKTLMRGRIKDRNTIFINRRGQKAPGFEEFQRDLHDIFDDVSDNPNFYNWLKEIAKTLYENGKFENNIMGQGILSFPEKELNVGNVPDNNLRFIDHIYNMSLINNGQFWPEQFEWILQTIRDGKVRLDQKSNDPHIELLKISLHKEFGDMYLEPDFDQWLYNQANNLRNVAPAVEPEIEPEIEELPEFGNQDEPEEESFELDEPEEVGDLVELDEPEEVGELEESEEEGEPEESEEEDEPEESEEEDEESEEEVGPREGYIAPVVAPIDAPAAPDDDPRKPVSEEDKEKKRLEMLGLSEDEIDRQLHFRKQKSRIRQYQNVIDILNSNFRKKRAEYGMVNRPTESYISAGSKYDRYYHPSYDYYSQDRADFYRKVRRPVQVEAFTNLLNKKIYYNKIIGKGRTHNNKFSNYYYGGDLYNGEYEEIIPPSLEGYKAFKHNEEKLDEKIDNIIENLDIVDKNDQYYSQPPIYSLTRDFYLIFKNLTISTKNSTIVGSSVSSSTFYPSDIDILEIVTSPSLQQTLQIFNNGIRSIIDKIIKADDTIFDHVKLGIDNRYPNHIGILHNGKIIPDPILITQIDNLHKQNLIDFNDFEYIKKCKGKGQEYYEKIKEILGEYRKIRWSEYDIGNGFKNLRGGKVISIEEACMSKAVINIEAFYILEYTDKLINASNFFILQYENEKGKTIGINYDGNLDNHLSKEIKKSIYNLYYSKLHFNPIKMIKRMFSLNKINNEKDKSTEELIKILKSELGVIYYVISYTKDLLNFLNKEIQEKSYVRYSKIVSGYCTSINQYIHGFSKLGDNKKNIIYEILNTLINNSRGITTREGLYYKGDYIKTTIEYLEKIGIILDNFLQKSIKEDKTIQKFMPPPAKYLPPKSEQEYHQ